MKRLFLCSQVYHVAESIAETLGSDVRGKMVFIDTCVRDKVRPSDQMEWHENNKKSLRKAGFTYDIYDISGKSAADIRQDLDEYETMYVEGGNTFYLLLKSQENGFGEYVNKRVESGMIYIGTSAGAIIAGPDTASGSRPGKSPEDYSLADTAGFGIVNFVIMPHWGDESKRELYAQYKIPLSYGLRQPFVLLNDDQYVEVKDDWCRIVDVTKV